MTSRRGGLPGDASASPPAPAAIAAGTGVMATLSPMATVTEMPPRGRYLAREVGALAGVSGDRIGQWARRGYIRPSQSRGRPNVYSYQDVAEAIVIHHLVDRGVPLRAIKKAIDTTRKRKGINWPLTGSTVYITADHPERPEGPRLTVVVDEFDTTAEHPVVGELDLEEVRGDLSRGGWAARHLTNLEHIEVDPDRLSGRPAVRGTRMAAQDVAEIAASPGGRQVLRDDYDLTNEQIEDAVTWWSEVSSYDFAA